MKLGICLVVLGLAFSLVCLARAQSELVEPSDVIDSGAPGGVEQDEQAAASMSPGLAGAEEPPAYRPLIQQALGEYQASNFGEARALFLKAHDVFPNARALRGLGMVEFELRNYGASIGYLSSALFSKQRPLVGPLRAETELLLARARQYVDRITLEVQPASCQVTVDGAGIDVPADGTLLLEVGQHAIEFHAPHRRSARRVVAVQGGVQQVIRVVLAEEPGAARSARPSSRRPQRFLRLGATGLAAYLHPGMTPLDPSPHNQPADASDTQREEYRQQGWDCRIVKGSDGDYRTTDCTVAIDGRHVVPTWAITPTLGTFFTPQVAVAVSAQVKRASTYGTLLSHVLFTLSGEYYLRPMNPLGANGWIKGGVGLGEVQIRPPGPSDTELSRRPWVASGLGNAHAGVGGDYRFDSHFGFYGETLAHIMFPNRMFVMSATAGLETVW